MIQKIILILIGFALLLALLISYQTSKVFTKEMDMKQEMSDSLYQALKDGRLTYNQWFEANQKLIYNSDNQLLNKIKSIKKE